MIPALGLRIQKQTNKQLEQKMILFANKFFPTNYKIFEDKTVKLRDVLKEIDEKEIDAIIEESKKLLIRMN